MTIEPVIETGWTATSFRDVITAGRRLLLRPHRRIAKGAGDAGNIHYVPFEEGTRWYTRKGQVYFDTRAQVAQAASLERTPYSQTVEKNPRAIRSLE